MATPPPLLGLDWTLSALNEYQNSIALEMQSAISPTCLLLKTFLREHPHPALEQLGPGKERSALVTKGSSSHWQLTLGNVTTCGNLKGQVHIFCSKCLNSKPLYPPHLHWIKERKSRTDALPRAPSSPQVQPCSAQNSQVCQ